MELINGRFLAHAVDQPALATPPLHDTPLKLMLGQLAELYNAEENDEYGVLRASQHAFEQAYRLLEDTASLCAARGLVLPRGCASTDAEGGIRVEWIRPAAAVHLVVPATSARLGYVYHEVGDNEFGTGAADSEELAKWLQAIN